MTAGKAGRSGPVEAAVHDLVAPSLSAAGLLVEEVRLTPAGSRRVLRILVDRDEAGADGGPLDLDEIAEASRLVSSALDAVPGADDPLGDTAYTLEVSSPGVDRPLTQPLHFRRNAGRLVTVRRSDGPEVTGRIIAAGSGGLQLSADGAEQVLGWDVVQRGQVQVEFTRREDVEG